LIIIDTKLTASLKSLSTTRHTTTVTSSSKEVTIDPNDYISQTMMDEVVEGVKQASLNDYMSSQSLQVEGKILLKSH